jgi:hypothetical protein
MDENTLYIEKAKLIEAIFEIEDVDIIKKIRSFIRRSIPRPAVMTVEELKAEEMEAVWQVENGEVISHEDLFKELGV